jgi:hypothetical protein
MRAGGRAGRGVAALKSARTQARVHAPMHPKKTEELFFQRLECFSCELVRLWSHSKQHVVGSRVLRRHRRRGGLHVQGEESEEGDDQEEGRGCHDLGGDHERDDHHHDLRDVVVDVAAAAAKVSEWI